MFPFGVQYYRPPTPPAEDWERDFARMKETGFNIVRGWLMWSWMNPAPGEYDFATEDRFLDLCEKCDMKAVLLFSLESVPPWVVKRHPEAVFIDHMGGKCWPEGAANHPVGGHPGLCFHNEAVKEKALEYLRNTVRRYRGNPAVACWEPHNEPMIEPARVRFTDENLYCYCEASIIAFCRWLEERYGSIEALNRAWHRKYRAFDEVYPPRFVRGCTFPDMVDWRTFWTCSLADMLRWRGRAIREEDPGAVIKIHSRAHGSVQGNVATLGMDDWKLAKEVDIFGGSFFFRFNPDTGFFLNNDDLASAAKGKEWWLSECQAGPPGVTFVRNKGADDFHKVFTPERLEMWSWIPISCGAKGLMYWQYRPELCGPEFDWGLTEMDGSPTRRLEIASKVGAALREHEELFRSAARPRSRIALGYTPVVNYVEFLTERTFDRYFDAMGGASLVLLHLDHPVDIIRLDEEAVDDDYSEYDVIILPFAMWISEKSGRKLEEFVRAGGLLVGDAGLADLAPNFFWSRRVPGAGLDEVFGCRRQAVSTKSSFNIQFEAGEVRARFFEEVLKPTTGRVIGRSEDGKPLAVENTYGRGRALYIGGHVFMEYSHSQQESFRELMRSALGEVPRTAYTDSPNVMVRVLNRQDGGRLLFVFNVSDEPAGGRVFVAEGGGISTLYGKETEFKLDDDVWLGALGQMDPYETRIFIQDA